MKEEVKKWIEKADKDLNTAKYNLRGNILDATVFFSQQSAEKGFKALLLKETNQFPKIHDLTKLGKLVSAPNEIMKLCSKINPGYIATRYPDQGEIYSKEETEEIIKYSEEVLKWIKRKLEL